jgi:hypothetical protein
VEGVVVGEEDGAVEGVVDGAVEGMVVGEEDGAVEGVVVGEELVDGLAELSPVLPFFMLRRFVPFPPSHSSSGCSPLRERDLYKRRKH